jgi:hypothetical protein
MIDLLELRIPFSPSHCETLSDGSVVLKADVFDWGINMAGKGLYRTEKGLIC